MSAGRPLRGACSCGRNQYVVNLESAEGSHVFFDDSSENRRSQGSPLTAWLRVPLTSYQSQTTSFYPDETHSIIRRSFTPGHAPHCKRVFCGFCGTQLSYWSEKPREEAEYINITIGSLLGEDVRALEELGLIAEDVPSSLLTTEAAQQSRSSHQVTSSEHRSSTTGLPWFDELIEGSRLGRTGRTSRGMGRSVDGSTTVEWEVSEWVEDGSGKEQNSGAKRKIDETEEHVEDTDMRGT